MTIQPNNQAPKFQDPAETNRAEEARRPDAVEDSRRTATKDKPVAKDGRHADPDSAAKRSPEEQAAAEKRSSEDQAQAAGGAAGGAVKKSPVANKVTDTDRATDSNRATDTDRATDSKRPTDANRATDANKVADAKKAPQNQAPVAARTRLFGDQEVTRFREQWRELQSGFVDEPRGAVREADTLVSQMMDTLTAQLAEQKRSLQGESNADDTEKLRVALQRYRSLFDQMLQV